MIVWLASYPRSGNTLTRTILNQVFAVSSCSIYDDSHDIAANDLVAKKVGHQRHGEQWSEIYQRLREDSQVHFVKTHGAPQDAGPAIYVVRDPVACFVSYQHYNRTYWQSELAPEEFVAGIDVFGSWSSHLDAWNPLERPNTLLLKYEDLVGDAETQIARIGEFCGLTAKNRWKNDFELLQKAEPKFFRRGRADVDDADIPPHDQLLIRYWTSSWSERLGYPIFEATADFSEVEALRRVSEFTGARIYTMSNRLAETSQRAEASVANACESAATARESLAVAHETAAKLAEIHQLRNELAALRIAYDHDLAALRAAHERDIASLTQYCDFLDRKSVLTQLQRFLRRLVAVCSKSPEAVERQRKAA